ncbi:MAG: tRNA pseudouridine(38-40) synthase TruA, partial [Bifidobacteriaceae bacterium]|nr:tRNA pseudouridine(38-40) synthase TruA [Bifidobacteriaceae bacterium]
AYDGAGFHGWAAQVGQRTVQGELERALERLIRRPVAVTVAGRTDAGVHARGQVAHLDLAESELSRLAGRSDPPASPDPPAGAAPLARRLNAVLADDVRVLGAALVGDGFDARFSALWRRYRYRVADRDAERDPLERGRTWWTRPLDSASMAAAAPPLLGEHDFAPFCVPRPGASTIRSLFELDVRRINPGRIDISVKADAFCHHMVRFIVGALAGVGAGRHGPDWPGQVLAGGRRPPEVQLAPAHGLTLEEVAYPSDDAAQAARAARARAHRQPGPV